MQSFIKRHNGKDLFLLKGRIEKLNLVSEHRKFFGPFDVRSLNITHKILKIGKRQDGSPAPVRDEHWNNCCRWGQIGFDSDIAGVYLGVKANRAFVFEGNKQGYGRRTWLNQDDTFTFEHGLFEHFNGTLLRHIDLYEQ